MTVEALSAFFLSETRRTYREHMAGYERNSDRANTEVKIIGVVV